MSRRVLPTRTWLPIDDAMPQILDAVRRSGACVVTAPPGSGKTTRVPGALLDAGLAGDGKVLVLQPRRVAARLAAERIAWERGVRLGEEVGYQVRFERRAGPNTRLELLTEGLLLRRLQADPFLEGVGCVVLDELHERSLHVDLALALLAELRREVREDLRLVVMSATLSAAPVAAFLGGCPVVEADGRLHPVEVDYAGAVDPRDLPRAVARALRAHRPPSGHVLVFLPGAREIVDVTAAIGELEGAEVLPLHGRLKVEAQARALAPSDTQKVVLATNIAETSVTLDGAAMVIDSGLARSPRFDPTLGLDRLELGRISAASAEQRAGRAGRTGPGRCVRLWSAHEQERLRAYDEPEVARTDLASAALQLYAWGVDPERFAWFERPPAAALAEAEALLVQLGAVAGGQLTALGRVLADLPVSPRLGAVVVAGHAAGCLREAAVLAALSSERDPFEDPRLDLHARVRRVLRGDAPRRGALQQVRQVARQLEDVAIRCLGEAHAMGVTEEELARALLAGFPDRVGLRRSELGERALLASGRGARLRFPEQLGPASLFLAVGLRAPRRGERAEALVELACPIEVSWLKTVTERVLVFDAQREGVDRRVETRYGALVLASHPDHEPADPGELSRVLAGAAARDPERALAPSEAAEALRARVAFVAEALPELDMPDFQDLSTVLPSLCWGKTSFAELRKADLVGALKGQLTWTQREALERCAPTSYRLPTGREARLRYEAGKPPVLAARIQQLFGLERTPTVADGRVPVLLHLLAPNNRPAQVTQDLASFWAQTYPEVRKDLRGRYPKHSWPEDPVGAVAEDRPGGKRG